MSQIMYEDYAWKVWSNSPESALRFFGLDPVADLWRVRVQAEECKPSEPGTKLFEIYTRDKTG